MLPLSLRFNSSEAVERLAVSLWYLSPPFPFLLTWLHEYTVTLPLHPSPTITNTIFCCICFISVSSFFFLLSSSFFVVTIAERDVELEDYAAGVLAGGCIKRSRSPGRITIHSLNLSSSLCSLLPCPLFNIDYSTTQHQRHYVALQRLQEHELNWCSQLLSLLCLQSRLYLLHSWYR